MTNMRLVTGGGRLPSDVRVHRAQQFEQPLPREQRARSLLFVAATRARDELIVSWNGRASRFLPPEADKTAYRATDLLTSDGPPSGSSGSAAA
ncbi:hypothetical protein [Streptomyces qinglanensis]|uniref:hypothetical protein n=1 Tax=Streptomyces qinglanensis TaxID=943816 RepID=UPI003D7553B1